MTDSIKTFDKKAISKIIHLSGNTYVDVSRVYLNSGGLVKINNETVIYTGKLLSSYYHSPAHFYIETRLGRVGRVIRRNNTISGRRAEKLYSPPTSVNPKWWSWHEGDREEIDVPTSHGGRICTAPGTFGKCTAHATTSVGEKEIKIIDDTSTLYQSIRISIADVTFTGPTGAGLSFTEILEVNNIKKTIKVHETLQNQALTEAAVSYFPPHATTSAGDYRIGITDDVWTLCPQQIISIADVTFTGPTGAGLSFTEILEVFGHEGTWLEAHPGYIIVRDAPDQSVGDGTISSDPTLVLYDKIA